MPITESNYENAVLKLFTDVLGYSHVYGPDIDRDYHDPLYEDLLLPSLHRINPGLPAEALNEAVHKVFDRYAGLHIVREGHVFLEQGASLEVLDFVDGLV